MQIDAFLAQDGVFRSVEDLFRCRLREVGDEDGEEEEEEEEEDGAAEEGKGDIKGDIKGKKERGNRNTFLYMRLPMSATSHPTV